MKLSFIGCGRISLKHIEAAIKNVDRLSLVAVCDPILERSEQRKAEYEKAFPDTHVSVYANYREMLKKEKPHICAIATESGYHPRIAIDCLEAGSHVICEKPMALSTQDADAMIDSARRHNRKLAVCFQNRFNAPVQRARAALEAGRFGKMLHGIIQVRWNRDADYYVQAPWRGTWALDGGTLMNQCTHGIDLLQWMMGEDAVRVQAATRRFLRPIEAEDFGAAIVEFASGAVGIIEGSADVFPKNLSETLSLFGEHGTVVIGGLAVNKIETWRFADSQTVGDTEDTVLDPTAKDPPTVYGFGHTALYADFLDALAQDREPLVNGEAGKKALELILAIYKSQKTGQPVTLPVEFSTSEMKGTF
ncbi:MAG: Glucose--fructose oxidoreductase precursor [Spirochaetes bacterium ADurb.Bin110]|nr:MAG: Glucose--fructose oxidoreductase precursor [Spirochaetes bacterium ADurb.Bin110]